MKKVVWGVLGTGKIGTRKVIPAMLKSDCCEIRAISSRSLSTARREADALGIPVAYGSYAELIADPDIEAIYNALPNHLHVPLTLEAAAAGKHVLCEKPIALSADEATALRHASTKVNIMEAFMVRFHPQWKRVHQLVHEGIIGHARTVQVLFSYFNDDPSNIRNQRDIGGGALYDIGCYAVVAGRYLFDTEPTRAVALVERDPTFGTDRMVSGLVEFGEGRHLDFTVSTQCASCQQVRVNGTLGRIEIQIPFNPNPDSETKIIIDDGTALDGSASRVEVISACDQYRLQGDAFSRAVRQEAKLPYGVDDAIKNMRVIDALFRSEKSGKWEAI